VELATRSKYSAFDEYRFLSNDEENGVVLPAKKASGLPELPKPDNTATGMSTLAVRIPPIAIPLSSVRIVPS
jgi:hypothetical protein